jgi:hypothetical protein
LEHFCLNFWRKIILKRAKRNGVWKTGAPVHDVVSRDATSARRTPVARTRRGAGVTAGPRHMPPPLCACARDARVEA